MSDLYVIPRYRTAFVNPFNEIPTLEILCSFYRANGMPYEGASEYVLKKAHSAFKAQTGYTFKALTELEYYVNSKSESLYPLQDQRGYHQSKPFAKFENLRLEALDLLARAGCKIKYGHSEVGSFTKGGEDFEQHEIEFLPVDAEDAADQLVVAKWILRMLSFKYGVEVSFAPKIIVGSAGSGLHIHLMLEKDGVNAMVSEGELSEVALKVMAGILKLSPALTAFGNTIPTSYLRLVPHQEAPTRIVLLRHYSDKGFAFYTNYKSRKADEILQNPFGTMNFFWPELDRQIIINGKITKTSKDESDAYFKSRPLKSQISAIISDQSKPIPSREYLERLFSQKVDEFSNKEIYPPDYWGGFLLEPETLEFWQGRPHRLNDRIFYSLEKGGWKKQRLAP